MTNKNRTDYLNIKLKNYKILSSLIVASSSLTIITKNNDINNIINSLKLENNNHKINDADLDDPKAYYIAEYA